jgi:hypothetical protein
MGPFQERDVQGCKSEIMWGLKKAKHASPAGCLYGQLAHLKEWEGSCGNVIRPGKVAALKGWPLFAIMAEIYSLLLIAFIKSHSVQRWEVCHLEMQLTLPYPNPPGLSVRAAFEHFSNIMNSSNFISVYCIPRSLALTQLHIFTIIIFYYCYSLSSIARRHLCIFFFLKKI